jgi:hypothetical protein
MRFFLCVVLCGGVVAPSSAQTLLPANNRPANGMVSDSNFHKPMTPHHRYRRTRRADPIIDGVLKGVAFGVATSFIGGGDQCMGTTPLRCVLRGAAMMGTLGGVIDALHERNRPIVDLPPFTPALRWRIRF